MGASIRAALSDANVASDGDGDRKDVEATLPAELRRIGACLLVLDHWEPREATNSFLQTLLQSAPELRLLLSCTEALSFPGVGQRQVRKLHPPYTIVLSDPAQRAGLCQVLLNPMPADEAGRLLRSLAPRPITRAEVPLWASFAIHFNSTHPPGSHLTYLVSEHVTRLVRPRSGAMTNKTYEMRCRNSSTISALGSLGSTNSPFFRLLVHLWASFR